MLVLSRKLGERIVIGDSIVVTVVRVDRGKIRLGIEAPPRIVIRRGELPQPTVQVTSARQACGADR